MEPSRRVRRLLDPIRYALGPVALCCLSSCAAPDQQAVVRLVDAFSSASITGTPDSSATPEPTEFRFDAPDHGWKAGAGIQGLVARDGRLAGRSNTAVPIVHMERSSGLDDADVLHEVVIRARVSEGANLSIDFRGAEELNFERILERADTFPWDLTTPLVPGDEVQSYTMAAATSRQTSIPASSTRHILVRPTDTAGAEFEIESVRLVFRKEHLTSIESGVGWQGLSEIYRETIVTRSPETAQFTLSLPSNPVLDLAIGTVEDGPVTFRVAVGDDLLVERTLTTPNRWEEVPLDLAAYAGREVTLSLSVDAEKEGALAFWGAPAIRQRGASTPRGVVLILLDTLRSDHLDAYGYERETAPTLTRLAREGVRFQDAIAQGAWTKVSAPSLLSSTYPTSNGIYEMAHKLSASADTIAETFREAGYATWGATANGFSGRGSNLHQGLEILHERGSIELPDGVERSKTARVLVDRLLPWLESHRDVPFFVFLHPIDPHSPYEPYRPYDTLWGAAGGLAKQEEDWEKVNPLVQENRRNGRLPHREDLEEAGLDPDEYIARTLDFYDGSIRAADAELQRVMQKLRELGIADDTLVVFVSDHGEEFLDHGGGFHEDNVYGELVNVPFLMRWPSVIPAGLVVEDTVQLLDMAPTMLELSGIPIPETMQGQSLAPLLSASGDSRWASRPAISEWTRRSDQRDRPSVDAFSIIVDEWKLIRNVERPEDYPEFELYNHAEDPLDQNDVAAQHPEIVERLATQLEGWHEWALANKLPTDAEATEGLDAAELEQLRSLGYVQ